MKRYLVTTVLATAVMASLVNIKVAHGKLVYEDELKAQNDAQVIRSGEGVAVRYRDPIADINQQPTSGAVVVAPAPSTLDSSSVQQADTVEMSKSEVMRRHRLRQELRNEDMLTQKLEELRFKDEMQRSQTILGNGGTLPSSTQEQQTKELPEQRIGLLAQAQTIPQSQQQPVMSQVSAVAKADEQAAAKTVNDASADAQNDEEYRFSITPRGGMSGILNSMYDIQSQYSFGLGIGADLSKYLAFQAGYTYSKYQIAAGGSLYNPYYYSLQQLQMTDHVFDMGLRANFLPSKARFRPFIGTGIGYRRGFVNYDERTLQMIRAYTPAYANDVEISAFLGYLETGLDVKLTSSLSLIGQVRYYNIFSSRQSTQISPYAFAPNNAGAGLGYNGDARNTAGNALSNNNFYSIMGGLSLSF